MKTIKGSVLAVNCGSSSIKFALYENEAQLTLSLSGEVENIGTANAQLNFNNLATKEKKSISVEAPSHDEAASYLVDWLEAQGALVSVKAIGHRIVHGMKHTEPEFITPELIEELRSISAFDPEHLPEEIRLIELFSKRHSTLQQIACFDTSFHTSMPAVAKMLTIPRRYYNSGIQRYGFHGLSYNYLLEELKREAGSKTAGGRIIFAHLGNGSSLAAVHDGKCMDTSMGFTPTSGLMMGSRTGDLDPGVASYLLSTVQISVKQFNHLVNYESGLLGISETSADMRELLKIESTDPYAAEAIELFCYQVKKWIGSFAATLGGLDTLVFSGGIGENASVVRSCICYGMKFLGIELDETKNANNESIISIDTSPVYVRVIKTNEELMIARMTVKYILKV